jgi:cellulose biosynthesis protein BcsQ
LSFNPEICHNESEVESKLIVQYLLPKLGYSADSWYQEMAIGKIRLDFLAVLERGSPLNVVMEAKHPRENLDRHVLKLRSYLQQVGVKYGLLTNGNELRIYERIGYNKVQLVFYCSGYDIDRKFAEIDALIGRDNLIKQTTELLTPENNLSGGSMKVIAIYHNKGGVGKTTTVVNLAAGLSKRGHRVLIIDSDSQSNTTFATGLITFDDEENDDIKDGNIYHLLSNVEYNPISKIVRKGTFTNPEVDVIPAHINLMDTESDFNVRPDMILALKEQLEQVKDQYDIVLIDTPPSLNVYAKIALITADYLLIPSDLKPFANQGLKNIKKFIDQSINTYRKWIGKLPIEILGILPSKISTNARFIQYSLPDRIKKVREKYGINILDSVIYEREDLAKCADQSIVVEERERPNPQSVLDYKPTSLSAQEFELLTTEILDKIGA